MNNKAIRILIVGGQGLGKTTLATKIAEIMQNKGVSVTVVDGGDPKPFRAAFDKSADYSPHTIATHPDLISAGEVMRCPASVIINLHKGTFHHIILPDELREPITAAANEQIAWVNEHYPMRNGRVAFSAELEISEEDKKKLIEIGGEVEKGNPVDNEEAVTKALKRLAQDLVKLAKKEKRRRKTYRYLRAALVILTCVNLLTAALLVGREGADFLRFLLFAFATGVLSNLFTND